MAVLTPINLPALSSSGPPEFPGLIAASIWIAPSILFPAGDSIRRLLAETTPVVSVWLKTKRISDGKHRLANDQVGAFTDQHGPQQFLTRPHAQHRQIMFG